MPDAAAGKDVLPVVGFVLVRGRCRACQSLIPGRHLLGELAVAVFWIAAVVVLGSSPWLPVVLVAPLAVLLVRSPLREEGARPLAAALAVLTAMGVLVFGVVGLVEGRVTVYIASGLRALSALLVGALLAPPRCAAAMKPPPRS